jgi:hypothetical protein
LKKKTGTSDLLVSLVGAPRLKLAEDQLKKLEEASAY